MGADGRPDGVPDQFWDAEKKAVRVPELAKSWLDLRRKVSTGEHKPPEKPDAYVVPKIEGVPETFIGADDPVWGATRQAAHKAGVTQAQLEAIMRPVLEHSAKLVAAKGGKPADPKEDAARIKEAEAAEFAKLGPNGKAVVADISGWIKGLESRGGLTAEEAKELRLLGSATGIRALAKLRALSGEKAIPTDALAEDDMTEADARRLLTEGHAQNDAAKKDKALRALRTLEKRGVLSLQRAN
jgi:hypothetical protein